MVEVAQSLAVNPVPGVGKNGAAVPSFIDRPSVGAFGEIIRVHQFQVLAGEAEFPSHEARITPEHAAAGFRRRLHCIRGALFHNRQVGTIELDLQS